MISQEIITEINENTKAANEVIFYAGEDMTSRIARGCIRVVSGQRGQYVEFNTEQLNTLLFHIPLDKRYKLDNPNVYYIEYRVNGWDNIKVYYQRKTVRYADYKVGLWYISPKLLYTDYQIHKPMKLFF